MAVLSPDKEWARRLIEELDDRLGFIPDPDATPEHAQELMRSEGIRPEDNLFSRDLIRVRYPE